MASTSNGFRLHEAEPAPPPVTSSGLTEPPGSDSAAAVAAPGSCETHAQEVCAELPSKGVDTLGQQTAAAAAAAETTPATASASDAVIASAYMADPAVGRAATPASMPSPGAQGPTASASKLAPGGAGLRTVWGLTDDVLLRAVLLEQPCLMEALLALLRSMAAQHSTSPHLQTEAAAATAPPGNTPAATAAGSGVTPSPGATACGLPVAAAAGGGVCEADVAEATMLQALCSQPVLTGGGAWPKRPAGLRQQQEVADGGEGCEGEEDAEMDGAVPDSSAEEFEMMSSLELARAVSLDGLLLTP